MASVADEVRYPIVDGLFYPSARETLARDVGKLIEEARVSHTDAVALITPHAAMQHIGELLAAAYKAASGRKIDRVVLLAQVHRETETKIILPGSHAFETPLGAIPVAVNEVADFINFSPDIVRDDDLHREEHSIEVQLPFVQLLFPEAVIVPVLLGDSRMKYVRQLTAVLRAVCGDRPQTTLFVATTNMGSSSGVGPRDIQADFLIDLIEANDTQGIMQAVRDGKTNPCGAACLTAMLELFGRQTKISLLARSRSQSHNGVNIVEYASLALRRGGGR